MSPCLFIPALCRSLRQYLCFPIPLSLSLPRLLFVSVSVSPPPPPFLPAPSPPLCTPGFSSLSHHSGRSTHQHSFHLQATPQALGRSHGCRATDSASGSPGRQLQEPRIHRRGHHRPRSRACRRVASRRGPPGARRAQVAVGRGHRVGRVAGTTQARTEGPGKVNLGLGHTRRGVQSHLAAGVHTRGGAARCTGPQSHLRTGAKPNNQPLLPRHPSFTSPLGEEKPEGEGGEGHGLKH